MWMTAALATVNGVALAILAARLVDGIGRRAALARAALELEVAGRDGLTADVTAELREAAVRRLERYLRPSRFRQTVNIVWEWVIVVAVATSLWIAVTNHAWWGVVVASLVLAMGVFTASGDTRDRTR